MFKLQHVSPNPGIELAEKYVRQLRRKNGIISIGGGSTIDVGKYVATKLNLYHKAIPTTAGTGSEVTKYSVLTVNGKKTTFIVNRPNEFELDRERIKSLPFLERLSGRLDAYCQSIESMWSPKSTPESIMYATASIRLLDTDPLLAANYSGRAIDITGTSVVHALSYGLTEQYNIPHGLACGLMMKMFYKEIVVDGMEAIIAKVDRKKIIDRAFESHNIENHTIKYTKEMISKLWSDTYL